MSPKANQIVGNRCWQSLSTGASSSAQVVWRICPQELQKFWVLRLMTRSKSVSQMNQPHSWRYCSDSFSTRCLPQLLDSRASGDCRTQPKPLSGCSRSGLRLLADSSRQCFSNRKNKKLGVRVWVPRSTQLFATSARTVVPGRRRPRNSVSRTRICFGGANTHRGGACPGLSL
jgi:hypothetical protein